MDSFFKMLKLNPNAKGTVALNQNPMVVEIDVKKKSLSLFYYDHFGKGGK